MAPGMAMTLANQLGDHTRHRAFENRDLPGPGLASDVTLLDIERLNTHNRR